MSFGAFLAAAWPAILIVVGIIAAAGVILWLVSGRGKKGKEESLDRVLRPMAFLKGSQGPGSGGGGRTSVR